MELYKILLNLGYERRKSQEEMFGIVEQVILNEKEDYIDDQSNVLLIEAPTGTGKSFGYLIPIIEHNQKAIISTKTKILQEQLRRDLEFLSSVRRNYFGKGINYLILKGKANYLCLDRFYDKENTLKQATIFGKVSLSKEIRDLIESQNWDGDVEFTNIPSEVWQEINIDEHYCDSHYRKSCAYLKDCFYYKKLKDQEKKADILVVNHSLLVLKEFEDTQERILVIDEAHELDEALVKSLTSSISINSVLRLIASIRDMLPIDKKDILDNVDVGSIFKGLFEHLFEKNNKALANSVRAISIPLDEPFFVNTLINLIYNPLNEAIKIIKTHVENTVMSRLEFKTVLSPKFKGLLEESRIFKKEFIDNFSVDISQTNLEDRLELELSRLIAKFRTLASRVSSIYNTLKYMEDEENKDYLGFVITREYSKKLNDYNYKIEAFPIFPKNAINLYDYKAVILTSATLDEELIELTTGITGEYYSLEHVFDYQKVNFIVKNISPKNKDLWKEELQDSLRYLRTFYEKVLVLLTSYEQMEYIPKDDDIIFQNTISLRKAIEMIENGDKNVLVGVDSVWTGIDVKGEKGLLMAKLPFDSPYEPIHYHRMKYFEKHDMDGFGYARKKAFLQFKQGFGRLIRSKEDKGTVIICDSRIWKYEEFVDFIKSLKVKIQYRQQRGD